MLTETHDDRAVNSFQPRGGDPVRAWRRTGAAAHGSRHNGPVQICRSVSRVMSFPAAWPRWFRTKCPLSAFARDG
jgi:hypothetical protein